MQGGRGRGDPFFGFGDPFTGFGGMPSLFGGRDPFDDPFFTRPFGGMLGSGPFGPAASPFMDMNPFGPSFLGPSGSPFMNLHAPRIQEHQPSLPNISRGPIIEELNSDDEEEASEDGKRKKENPRKHGRSDAQSYVEHPDGEVEGRKPKHSQYGNQFSIMNNTNSGPQARSFSFQSSTVTYGGSNGAYYTSSNTRRTGSDGLTFEEHKEADSVTGKAAHRISKGIYDKGHTVTRNLNSEGRVDTMQMLHNINEDELSGFEEAWKGKARKHLPGRTGGSNADEGSSGSRMGRRALPSTGPPNVGNMRPEMENNTSSSRSQPAGRTRPDSGEHAQSSKVRRR